MHNLKVLDLNQKMASSGKFRAVTLIDSEMYQIGEDVETVEMAQELCRLEARSHDQLFQVFDDKGNKFI